MMNESMRNALAGLGVCKFCEQYFNKKFEFEPPTFAHNSDIRPETMLEMNVFKLTEFIPKICPNCIGLAQVANDPNFLEWIVLKTKASGYEFDHFNFNFKMPLSLKFRQRFVINHLRQIWESQGGAPADFSVFDFDLKLSIKSALNHSTQAKLGVSVSPTEDFVINLEFSNLQDEEELVA